MKKKNVKFQNKGLKKGISNLFEIPGEVLMDMPRITILGKSEVYIENHKGIIQYNKESIKVNTSTGILLIAGEELAIKEITAEDIIVYGNIKRIEYVI